MADNGLTPGDCSQLIDALRLWECHAASGSDGHWRTGRVAVIEAKLLQMHETKPPTPPEPDFDFGEALKRVAAAKYVARKVWSKRRYIGFTNAGAVADVIGPHLWIRTRPESIQSVWTPLQGDMLAHNWYEVDRP